MKGTIRIVLLVSIGILAAAAVLNAIFGTSGFGFFPYVPIIGGVVAYWFLGLAKPVDVTCPACNAAQPFWRKPASLRQGLFGGHTCASCGTEMDRTGRAISSKG